MDTPLNASSTTAGALLSGGRFDVPQFQREYAWEREEVGEFFRDLSQALGDETYFLGLVIVTGTGNVKDVVDGQQRLLTLTVLASALYHEARRYERRALAERIQSTFMRAIDFETDEEQPRLELSSKSDNETLLQILAHPASELRHLLSDEDTVSGLLISAYRVLSERLAADLQDDPFKRLGAWADFLTNRLYFATFVHPDPASAYRVFEVINTRGKELTTADLLKSYVLSQTAPQSREKRYEEWQEISGAFSEGSANILVQFIRHAITTERGYVAPRDLYDVLTGRDGSRRSVMTPKKIIELLQHSLPLYLQMMDPTASGPATEEELAVFSVLNSISVLSVRPILLAIHTTSDSTAGMLALLRLVIRRIVVGSLGTGTVERRFGQTAQRIIREGAWQPALEALADLNPDPAEFASRVHHRSMNKNALAIVRASVLQQTVTPEPTGSLYLIKPRNADWSNEDEDRVAYWVSTIGNSFLANEARRPMGSSSWEGFKRDLIPEAVDGEWVDKITAYGAWDLESIDEVGGQMAEAARAIWYD